MAETLKLDWNSSSNEILLNPRIPNEERAALMQALEASAPLAGHVWLSTSGSSGRLKWVALAKQAILSSAAAVNHHLESKKTDIWLNPLPLFHVGGIGILARAWLSGAKVIPYDVLQERWDPQRLVQLVADSSVTLTALVPAQVFDLVRLQLPAPKTLRAVIVGGGALNGSLYHQAVALGWKVLPSYGLTECASQVATALLGSWESNHYPTLQPLTHVHLELDEHGFLKVRSKALLSLYAEIKAGQCFCSDPKVDDWFVTEDQVVLENGKIKQVSRGEGFFKIGGESVDLLRLEKILEELLLTHEIKLDAAILALPDARLGHAIHLAVTKENENRVSDLVEKFAARVFPFERIRQVHYVDSIPRSPLRKILKKELYHRLTTH